MVDFMLYVFYLNLIFKKGNRSKVKRKGQRKKRNTQPYTHTHTYIYIYLIRITSSRQHRFKKELQREMVFKDYQNIFKSHITLTRQRQLGVCKGSWYTFNRRYNSLLELAEERFSESPPMGV